MMLDKITKQNSLVLDAARTHAAGETKVKPSIKAGDDDMGVSIGNEYRVYYQGQNGEEQPALPAPNSPAPAPANGSAFKNVAGGALLAAMLGGGGLLLGSYLPKDPSVVSPVVVQQPSQPAPTNPPFTDTDTDTNTKYKFDVGNPSDYPAAGAN